jgi:hypothetical protein
VQVLHGFRAACAGLPPPLPSILHPLHTVHWQAYCQASSRRKDQMGSHGPGRSRTEGPAVSQ